MSARKDILALTANANLQSKECYQIVEFAANIADAAFKEEADKQTALTRREIDRLYKVQAVIIAAGLLNEYKFKEAYDIICNT